MADEHTGPDAERTEQTEDLTDLEKRIQSAEDKVRTKYSRQVKDLEAELDELRAKLAAAEGRTVQTVEGLTNEIATVRAERELVKRQTRMIAKALEGGIDPALAVRFAETADADSTFDLAVAEIERRTKAAVNEKLGGAGGMRESGTERSLANMTYQDILRLPADEQRRIPSAVLTRALDRAAGVQS